MIVYQCPHCENELRIDDKYAGQKGTCNHCRNSIVLPSMPTIHAAGDVPQRKFPILFWVLAVLFPPAAIVWAYTLRKTHPQWKIGLIAPGIWLVIALIVSQSSEQNDRAEDLRDVRVRQSNSQPTDAPLQSDTQLESAPVEQSKANKNESALTAGAPTRGVESGLEKESKPSGVVCDRFNVIATLENDTVRFRLDTDLPDDTGIAVSVSRVYYEKGNTSAYSREYLSEKSTVGEWRQPRSISVSDEIFLESLQQLLDKMAGMDMPFQVAKIEDEIEVRFIVPVVQSNPSFGVRNENLRGLMVPKTGLKAISGENVLFRPLQKANSRMPVARKAFAMDLVIGKAYQLSKKAPLMPEFEPRDPMSALERMIYLPPSSSIVVEGKKMDRETPWYYVQAYGPDNGYLGKGWINSTALLGQDIWIR